MKKIAKISDRALKLISQKQIKPIPRWKFIIRNWGIWLILIVCLAFFVLGSSLSWFGLADNIIFPHFWLSTLVVFFTLSFLIFEKTKKAYRYQKRLVVFSLLVLGLTIGGILFKTGLANRLDRGFEGGFPGYRHLVPIKLEIWNNPSQGYLSGKITKVNQNNFELEDFTGKTWIVTGTPLVKGRQKLEEDVEIKLIGTKTGDSTFTAQEIRPWNGRKSQ